jgi:cell division GTPase FtsZ
MKPSDRALEIVVVGLGQAGGNLATEFARLGYRALALNTAHTDLSSLAPGQRTHSLPSEQRLYIGIDGYDGAGADLNYGRECVQANAERIKDVVAGHADGADVVLLAAGLGGGTGSSVSELVRVLKDLGLPLIVLTTLPSEYESGIAKVNAVRAVSDLVKQTDIGWIFADNSRLSRSHGGVSLDKYFEKINSVIVEPLDAFNRLNDRSDVHPIRALDGEDFRALLLSTGTINYAQSTLSELTVEGVAARVRENLQNSTMMPGGFALEDVAYMGVVLEAPEETLAGTPFTFFEQVSEQLKDETGGGAIYMGMYRTQKPVNGGVALLRMFASTHSLPDGVQAMVNDARREGGMLRDKLQRSMSALDLGEIEDFDLFKTSVRSNQHGHAKRRPSLADDLALPEVVSRGSRAPAARARDAASPKSTSTSSSADAEPDPAASQLTSVNATPAPASVRRLSVPPHAVPARPGAYSSPPPPLTTSSSDPADTLTTGSTDFGDEAGDDLVEMSADMLVDEGEDLGPVSRRSPESDQEFGSAETVNYPKLATTFLRTGFESTRRRVAQRLSAALNSADLQHRKLAEQAIERIRAEGQYLAFQAASAEAASAGDAL